MSIQNMSKIDASTFWRVCKTAVRDGRKGRTELYERHLDGQQATLVDSKDSSVLKELLSPSLEMETACDTKTWCTTGFLGNFALRI
jgi:ferredoxin